MENQNPELSHMFGAYFHQDWDVEGDDWPDLVQNYLRDMVSHEVRATASEIDRLILEGNNEQQLKERLHNQLGCYYAPSANADGSGYHGWLSQIADMLRGQFS